VLSVIDKFFLDVFICGFRGVGGGERRRKWRRRKENLLACVQGKTSRNFMQLVKIWWELFDKSPEWHITTRPRSKALLNPKRRRQMKWKTHFRKSFIIMAFYDYFCLLLFCYFAVFNVILA
jgi:hypothetical protein